jgi:hypothetical protein
MTDRREVLSALIDREPVDPDVLARVLEEPEGRAMLVDFVRVRAAVNADEPEEAAREQAPGSGLPAPGSGPVELPDPAWGRASALHDRLPASGSVLQAPGRSHGSRWLRVAAVFLLLAAGAGGGAWVQRYVARERPPEPDRIVRLLPFEGDHR